jgi:hypothetical protein
MCQKSAAGAGGRGIPRLSEADREILDRITTGDLVDEFQAGLDARLAADPLLGGQPANTD